MRQQVLAWLADHVPAPRIRHILGVEEMAIALARHHGLNAEKAGIAGLMHDLAKYFPSDTLLQMAKSEGLKMDAVLEANPHLLHADASAIVAREEFAVYDEEVLAAIGNHTLGRPNMSLLSCVVYVADALEPNRGHSAELQAMRKASWKDLHSGVYQTSDYSIKHLLDKQRLIHPRTIQTRNWALQQQPQTSKPIEKQSVS